MNINCVVMLWKVLFSLRKLIFMSIEGGRYVLFSEKKVFEIEMLARYIHSLTVNNLDLE